jgi:site-specific recombinase XerD
MRVVTVRTKDNKERYMVVDNQGQPVVPIIKYLKFKDNTGSSRNTLRTYSYHLKLFFEFLYQKNRDYLNVNIDDFADFVGWLRKPDENIKISYIIDKESKRSNRTINAITNTVLLLYEYIMQQEDESIRVSEKLKRQLSTSRKGFKGFFSHVDNNTYSASILRLKEGKARLKTISKNDVELLINSCTNLRDVFLIQLLWETGMRIGEALALWLEDFNIGDCIVSVIDRGELVNKAEIKTVNSERTIDVSQDLMNAFMDYISEYHVDDVDTNHVFIKLTGVNKNDPMEYQDVVSLFNRLKRKTQLNISPHVLRHTSLTQLRNAGWDAEKLRIRAGHADVQTTLQMYIHPTEEDIRNEWEKVSKKMSLKIEKGGNSYEE